MEALVQGQVDVAHLGGFTFVQANKRAGAVPLVQRDRDREFHSKFITARDDLRSLGDLKAKRFAFGDVNSTSGHLMPAYFMRKEGVDPSVVDQAIYTGGHDATALAVAERRVDAGALDEAVWERLTKEGKVDPSQGPRLLDHAAVRTTTSGWRGGTWTRRWRGRSPTRSWRWTRTSRKTGPSSSFSRRRGATCAVDAAAYGPLREAAVREGLLR